MNDLLAADLIKAVTRVAVAYERMVALAEAKQQRPAAAPNGGGDEPAKGRKPKGDILTVTDRVANFGIATDTNGNTKLTKPKGKEGEPGYKPGKKYWKLKLAGGFEAMVFSESQAQRLGKAFSEGLTVIIEYTTSGQYSNIESVKLASGGAAPATTRQQPAATTIATCCGKPVEQCDCAF